MKKQIYLSFSERGELRQSQRCGLLSKSRLNDIHDVVAQFLTLIDEVDVEGAGGIVPALTGRGRAAPTFAAIFVFGVDSWIS